MRVKLFTQSYFFITVESISPLQIIPLHFVIWVVTKKASQRAVNPRNASPSIEHSRLEEAEPQVAGEPFIVTYFL